jgi:hypothetical protein
VHYVGNYINSCPTLSSFFSVHTDKIFKRLRFHIFSSEDTTNSLVQKYISFFLNIVVSNTINYFMHCDCVSLRDILAAASLRVSCGPGNSSTLRLYKKVGRNAQFIVICSGNCSSD